MWIDLLIRIVTNIVAFRKRFIAALSYHNFFDWMTIGFRLSLHKINDFEEIVATYF